MLRRSSSSVTDLRTLDRDGTSSFAMVGISISRILSETRWLVQCVLLVSFVVYIVEEAKYGRPMGKWNLWIHREKLIKGFWRAKGVTWSPSHIASSCIYLICISENSFPVAVLLTDKQPYVSAHCRHSMCTYFLVELEYRNAIRNENSDYTLLPIGSFSASHLTPVSSSGPQGVWITWSVRPLLFLVIP